MMQRKKHSTAPSAPKSTEDDNAKHKPSSHHASSTKAITTFLSLFCLPGVPAPLKFILATFLSFAALMVITSKDHHVAFHYGRNKGLYTAPHMPEPLRVTLKKRITDKHEQRGPSNFVESEKKLKKQLLKLMKMQQEEKQKYHGRNTNEKESLLGVKIANRYLGEDLLPYPQNKGDELEWEKRMEARKEELRKVDEKEWKQLMIQYNEAMENRVQDFVANTNSNQNTPNEPPINNSQTKPKSWPPPSDKAGPNTKVLLQPAFGSHRPTSNAIFVFAEGYDLPIYLAFIESLSSSGYTGDVVISIASKESIKPGVKEYLLSKNTESGLNIVGYEVEWTCFKHSGEMANGSGEGVNHCRMDHVFGDLNGNVIPDPREARPVATARYELYWMWSLRYEGQCWIMLIDARDAWFQMDPFEGLGKNVGSVGGELHLFGENADAVRIGTSNYNRHWLITAYGQSAVEPYFEKPVICSGSTIGHQVAIENYLRAMVAEFDSTNCKSKGCDQGFHNYLYYSGQLGDEFGKLKAAGISKIIVHEQGTGIINNLAALRDKPLSEWGLYDADKGLVLNWDGSTSAVAHQYDRDKDVNAMVKKKKHQFEHHLKDAVDVQR